MSDFSKFHEHQSEALHVQLFALHSDIYFGALERIKKALLVLHELEGRASDIRPQLRGYIAEFEILRTHLEEIGRSAATFRSRLITENGCGGNCHDEAKVERAAVRS